MIERRLENLLALDYPAGEARARRRLGRLDRPHRRARRAVRRPRREARALPARRQGRGPEPRRAADERRGGRLLGRERDVGARRAAEARPQLRRSRRRLRLRPAAPRAGRRRQPRGRVLALRAVAAGQRVATRLGHRRQRLDLRRAADGLRRRRSALRPRPLLPVPDGAARPPRGVRARGARVREADADERGRVPPQGADVRALLGDRRRGAGCCAGSRRATRSSSSRTGICATRAGSSIWCCSRRASPSSPPAPAGSTTWRSALQLGLLAAAAVGVGIARYYVLVSWATVVALWNALRAGVPPVWEKAEGTR